jgi:hypothetical protein
LLICHRVPIPDLQSTCSNFYCAMIGGQMSYCRADRLGDPSPAGHEPASLLWLACKRCVGAVYRQPCRYSPISLVGELGTMRLPAAGQGSMSRLHKSIETAPRCRGHYYRHASLLWYGCDGSVSTRVGTAVPRQTRRPKATYRTEELARRW